MEEKRMFTDPSILWELTGITKTFPGVCANHKISLRLRSGEIHGLLGQNGSGKSTLIKILAGVIQPDAGEMRLMGRPIRLPTPHAARVSGTATVFQEFSSVGSLSVAENIFLGRLPMMAGGLLVDWVRLRREAVACLRRLQIELDPDAEVGKLSIAEQQLVEIAKAIAKDARLIILDEPTTALGLAEVHRLHELLRLLKRQGRALLYVSHRLDEVVQLVDVVTILRNGKVVSPAEESALDMHYIVGRMIGLEVREHYPKEHNATDAPLFEVQSIRTRNKVNGVTFTVNRGEVIGLGGVLGSGRTEIARALFGVDPLTDGVVRLNGRKILIHTPKQAIGAGIAYIPENRKADGLFTNFDGARNISIAALDRLINALFLDLKQEEAVSRDFVEKLQISPGAESKLVEFLSGGNQQKILVARWLYSRARLFILDEPTYGIDVGARIAVYRLINELTAAGRAVVLISSDHDELLAMSDRIVLVRRGSIVRIGKATEFTHADLVQASAETLTSHLPDHQTTLL
jgi:ribose transport system ATP-binding protein